MTLSALGIFSAAGAGGPVFSSDYELIETQILGSTQASVTFSSLGTYSSTYKHLQVRYVARSTFAGGASGGVGIQLNSDTGNNYDSHHLLANGSSLSSSAFTSQAFIFVGWTTGAGAAANIFSPTVFDILDAYSTTKNKTVRSVTGGMPAATGGSIYLRSGQWRNTASITSIKIDPRDSTSWVAGSRFSIYGIKG
jgi:hypothetical protein